MPARRSYRTVPLGRKKHSRYAERRRISYGSPGAGIIAKAPAKKRSAKTKLGSASRAVRKAETAVKKLPASRKKTVAVADVKKAVTAVKRARKAVVKTPVYRPTYRGAYAMGYGTAPKRRGRRRRAPITRILPATLERLAKPVGIGRGRRRKRA